MYCTKCGKELYPDDRFCAYCGAEVRNREKPKPKYEDIVFNPPFKIEAEKKTREILQAASQPQPEETPKQTEPVSSTGSWKSPRASSLPKQRKWILTGKAFWNEEICPARRRLILRGFAPRSWKRRADSVSRRARTQILRQRKNRRDTRKRG